MNSNRFESVINANRALKESRFKKIIEGKLKPASREDYYGWGGVVDNALVYRDQNYEVLVGYFNDTDWKIEISFSGMSIQKSCANKQEAIKYGEMLISFLQNSEFID